jgi:hypothetical protein
VGGTGVSAWLEWNRPMSQCSMGGAGGISMGPVPVGMRPLASLGSERAIEPSRSTPSSPSSRRCGVRKRRPSCADDPPRWCPSRRDGSRHESGAWSSTAASTPSMPILFVFLSIDAVDRSRSRQCSPFELPLDLVTSKCARSPRPDLAPPVAVVRAARIHSLVVGSRLVGSATWCLSRLRETVRAV